MKTLHYHSAEIREVPEKVRYIAMDQNRELYGFAEEPEYDEDMGAWLISGEEARAAYHEYTTWFTQGSIDPPRLPAYLGIFPKANYLDSRDSLVDYGE